MRATITSRVARLRLWQVAAWQARAPMLVAAVLGVACVAQLGAAIAGFVRPRPPLSQASRAPSPAVAAGLDALLGTPLFGVAAEAIAPAAAAASTLVLTGTIATADPKQGYALIGETAATARLWRTGQDAGSGAHLLEVYADRAIIERAGALEVLRLPHAWTGAGTLASLPPLAPAASTYVPQLSNAEKNRLATRPSAIRARDPRGEVFRALARWNDDGSFKGYRVTPGRDLRRFRASGLRWDDVIVAIDDVALDNSPAAQSALTGIVTKATAGSSVTVLRDGVPTQIVVAARTAP